MAKIPLWHGIECVKRWKHVKTDKGELTPTFPGEPVDKVPGRLDPIISGFFKYYTMKRGFHPTQ
jgi:hypothetical protein